MRISVVKLSVVGALVAAFAMALAATASADTSSCTLSGTIKLSPGLSETAQAQNVQVKGSLSGCSGEETKSGAKFNAHYKTPAVTCATLTSPTGAPSEEGGIIIKKLGTGGGNSMGTFSMPLTEEPVSLGGLIESGPFSGDVIEGSATQTYSGTCGGGHGKGKPKKVNKGSVSGSLSIA